MRQLMNELPATGFVVIRNANFETGQLKKFCELLLEFKPWLRRLTPRILGLLLPILGFRCRTQQDGSASVKAVLPTLTGGGYKHLVIQEGGADQTKVVAAKNEDPGNPTIDFRGEARRNATHPTTTGPDNVLNRKPRPTKSWKNESVHSWSCSAT